MLTINYFISSGVPAEYCIVSYCIVLFCIVLFYFNKAIKISCVAVLPQYT